MIKGAYTHPDQLRIGDKASEDRYLAYIKGKGGNSLNLYARAYMVNPTGRKQLNDFAIKAKAQGITHLTVDVRRDTEIPSWELYYQSYGVNIEPLTEKEPWVDLDYAGTFLLLDALATLKNKYACKVNFYIGWMGSKYTNPQEAVDRMVKVSDRIYISNYVTTSDFLSTQRGLGAWDNRMDKRCASIAIACKTFSKKIEIVEIVSLEPEFCFDLYAKTGKNRSFYGTMYNTNVITAYKQSTQEVLTTTSLVGRTIFYSKYMQQAQP